MATCPSGHESASDDFCDVCGYVIGAPASLGTGLGAGPAPADGPARAAAVAVTAAGAPAPGCPRCGTPQTGQFCEACGYRFPAAGGEPLPVTRIEPGLPARAAPQPGPVTPGPVTPGPVTPGPVRPGPVTPDPVMPEPASPWSPAPAVPPDAAWTAVVTASRAYYDSVQATGGPDAGAITFPVYCPERRFRLAGSEARIGRRSTHSGIDPEIDLTGPPADPGVSRLHAVLIRAADGSWSVIDPGSANGTHVNGDPIARDQMVPLRDGDRIHLGAWTELVVVREG